MKKNLIFPIAYGFALTLFACFSVLDTLVIPHVNGQAVFSFESFDTPSNSSSKSSSNSSNKSNSSTSSKNSSSNSSNSSSASSSTNSSSSSINSSSKTPGSTSGTSISTYPYNPPEVVDGETFFTEEEILTEDRYSNKNVYVKIYKEVIKTNNIQKKKLVDTTVFYADVRLSNLGMLRTEFAKQQYGKNIVEKTSSMAKRVDAIFAVNGDYYGAQEKGYVVRNGQLFRDTPASNREDLVLYKDGSFDSFKESEMPIETLMEKNPWQVFSFGPTLLKDNEVVVGVNQEVAISNTRIGNQRTGFGIVEPLHYIFAVCNGRTSKDYGMSLYEMGDYLRSKGCQLGYNLDGGGSSSFYFKDGLLNKPTEDGWSVVERSVSDIVYIAK